MGASTTAVSVPCRCGWYQVDSTAASVMGCSRKPGRKKFRKWRPRL
jgi:hypothetical protein